MNALVISVIIITLNEAANLGATIKSARNAAQDRAGHSVPMEIIVSDGGSTDDTCTIAQRYADRFVGGSQGRANQLNAGARVASGDILLFLHADTILPAAGLIQVWHAMGDPRVIGGGFMKDWIWSTSPRRSRVINTARHVWQGFGKWVVFLQKKFPGDNAMFVRRTVFWELGGFKNLWICEDFDFSRRLVQFAKNENYEVICLREAVRTSARRFEKDGFIHTLGEWAFIYSLWRFGMPQYRIKSLFQHYSTRPDHPSTRFRAKAFDP